MRNTSRIFICMLLAFLTVEAQACIVSTPPSETRSFLGVLSEAESFYTVQTVCENCKEGKVNEFKLVSEKSDLLLNVNAFLSAGEPGHSTSTLLDLWAGWRVNSDTCGFLPIWEDNVLIDVLVKSGEVIWWGYHKPFLANNFNEGGIKPRFKSFFLKALAWETFSHADMYWQCSEQRRGYVFETDLVFEKRGKLLPSGDVGFSGPCPLGDPFRGFAIRHSHSQGLVSIYSNGETTRGLGDLDSKLSEEYESSIRKYLGLK